jgi:hypothetical protein
MNINGAGDNLQNVAAPPRHIFAKKMTNSGNPFRPQLCSRRATFDRISTGLKHPKARFGPDRVNGVETSAHRLNFQL